jgi:hypothetical protein
VQVLDRLDFILRTRLRGRPLVLGAAFLGVLFFSLLLFLLAGNGKAVRVLFFPAQTGRGMVAEERLLPRHRILEQDVAELAEGVLLGPTRHDALRIFPRGGSVLSSLVHGRTLYSDLSPRLLVDDPEVPLKGEDALAALARSIRFNFPRVRQIVFFIDGQIPRFPEKKNI